MLCGFRSLCGSLSRGDLASFGLALAAYLVGSISFAVVSSKLFGLPDPHSYGSGNPGATNVLRTGNKLAALPNVKALGVAIERRRG